MEGLRQLKLTLMTIGHIYADIRVDRLFPQRLRHLPEIAETVPRFRHFFCPDSGLWRSDRLSIPGLTHDVMSHASKLSFGILENKSDI